MLKTNLFGMISEINTHQSIGEYMKYHSTFLTIMALVCFGGSVAAFAQTDSSSTTKCDSTDYETCCKTHHRFSHDWDFSDGASDWSKVQNPFISVFYGGSGLKVHNLNTDFNKYGFGEIKVGFQRLSELSKDSNIINFRSHYIDINGGSKDFYNSDNADKLTAHTLQFGYAWNTGYGYNLGCSNIILTHSFGLGWTRLRLDDLVTNSVDAKKLAYYDNSFRFGLNSEAGIQAQIIPLLSINAAYSRAMVYPRVMFWKASGSVLTEAIGYGLVDQFVGKVLKSSPAAAPIVNFLLKNGIAYGMHELRKEKMNFPFGGESPLMADTYKIGLTFSF
jgi:hypothetical protein